METRDDSSRRFRLSHVQAEFFAITVEGELARKTRPGERGRKSMESRHRDPGCELVIAGSRRRLSP
jgi:hypothetical protein